MLRPSPKHGTQRLPNDDDDDGDEVLLKKLNLHTYLHYYRADAKKTEDQIESNMVCVMYISLDRYIDNYIITVVHT